MYSFLKTRTHGKNGTKSTYEPTNHTWNSTPSQHFVHLQPNAMLISLRVAITAVTLFKADFLLCTMVKHHQTTIYGICLSFFKHLMKIKSKNILWGGELWSSLPNKNKTQKNASFDLEFRWIWVPNFWRPHPLIHEEKGEVTS